MRDNIHALIPHVWDRFKFLLVIWGITAAFLWTENQYAQRQIMEAQAQIIVDQQAMIIKQMAEIEDIVRRRVEVELIRSRTFSDYYKYYRILPAEPVVDLGAEAWYVSDAHQILAGYRIKWEEYIECDHDPYDGVERFTFYKQAVTTSIRIDEVAERIDPEGRKGYPATNIATGEPIKYPSSHEADCRMVSEMTQYHKHGETKHFTMRSKVVKVRRLA